MNHITFGKKVINYAQIPPDTISGVGANLPPKLAELAQDVVEFTIKPLQKNSDATDFFGVSSPSHIATRTDNHTTLVEAYSNWRGIPKTTFPDGIIFIEDQKNIARTKNIFQNCFNILRHNSAVRVTIYSPKIFGKHGFHTLGMVYDQSSKTLYCLDSLSNKLPEVQNYQRILTEIFQSPNNEIEQIIFSNKAQQHLDEYTCNNWSFANIFALKDALKHGKRIDSVEALNECLPNDINKILEDQQDAVLTYRAFNK